MIDSVIRLSYIYFFLYSAVSSPLDRSKRFTLVSIPERPVHSDTNSASTGNILAMQQLRATTKSLTFPPLPIARYSFIQLSEQGRQWRERNCPLFDTVAKGIRTRALLIASPAFYSTTELSRSAYRICCYLTVCILREMMH